MAFHLDIILAVPLWQPLSYSISPKLAELVQPLSRVLVPLRKRLILGFALAFPEEGEIIGLRSVVDVLDKIDSPSFAPTQLDFFRRAAAYYQIPLGQALAWSLPAGLLNKNYIENKSCTQNKLVMQTRQKLKITSKLVTYSQGFLAGLEMKGVRPLVAERNFSKSKVLTKRLKKNDMLRAIRQPILKEFLTQPFWFKHRPIHATDQQKILKSLLPSIMSQRFKAFLLYSIPGAATIEIYLAACEEALRQGRNALLLVPKIELCLRLEEVLHSRFGLEIVAVLHSGLTQVARQVQWQTIASGKSRVVMGTRSAVFAPLANIGIICVDEEHDETYKEENRFRYNGRDLAFLRSQEESCPILLGTSTPAVNTWQRSKTGKLSLFTLSRHVNLIESPRIEVVDLKKVNSLEGGFLSSRLRQAIIDTLARGKQVMLFLNRRGFSPAFICTDCGKIVACPACSLSLSLHQERKLLICHACGYRRFIPSICSFCSANSMHPLGLGIEAVVAYLSQSMPELRLARLDSELAATPSQLKQMLQQIAEHKIDVIVGTQLINRGYYFPLVSLIGILLADQSIAYPNFRAAERAYIFLSQLIGQISYKDNSLKQVIIQTFDPSHHVLRAIVAHKPEIFYETELAERQILGYPPYMRIMLLRLEGRNKIITDRVANEFYQQLEKARCSLFPEVILLGPAPAPIARIRYFWRQIILLKANRVSSLGRVFRQGLYLMGTLPAGIRLTVDVDPINLS